MDIKMSGQAQNAAQKLRRNISPSVVKQGPMRATRQFSLASPPRTSQKTSPIPSPSTHKDSTFKSRNRPLSETGIVTERRNVISPGNGLKIVNESKTISVGRCNSFDNLMTPYLSGQWPKDGLWHRESTGSSGDSSFHYSVTGAFTADKHTQTPDNWDDFQDKRNKKNQLQYKRSHSFGSCDPLKNIKHKLQRNGSHGPTVHQARLSPSLGCMNQTNSSAGTMTTSQPIKIPIVNHSTSSTGQESIGKTRGSVEGLNQEVERLIISGRHYESDNVITDEIDGHKAPVIELLTRTTDTQTPIDGPYSESLPYELMPIMLEVSEQDRCSSQGSVTSQSLSNADDSDRCVSVSPLFMSGPFDLEDATANESNSDGRSNLSNESSNLYPKNNFLREPPDGAEKVKIVDELSSIPPETQPYLQVNHIRFQPSATSAFKFLPMPKRE